MSVVGFMQGRLSPLVNGRIQAFPASHWREEFPAAQALGLRLMEWTLDHEGLADNPLMSPHGRTEIRELCASCDLSVPSLTGDCFMQAPFWKAAGASDRAALLAEFDAVMDAAADLGIGIIVVPLVDNGRVELAGQAAVLRDALLQRVPMLAARRVRVAFESDLPALELTEWISGYPPGVFGINYDTGNSASLGYDVTTEWAAYGSRIINVHIKDRLLGGSTVPLGGGNCNFPAVFRAMREAGYAGNLILQTARAADGNHAGALARYRDFVVNQIQTTCC
jgi:L-ribulose-5-phosphate 3-epimerase